MLKWLWNIRFWLLTSVVLILFFLDFSDKLIIKSAKDRLYDSVECIEKRKVGLVLGTSKLISNGSINLYFRYRVDAAVQLFNSGKIEYILVSGDNSIKDYNEPEDFKQELIKRGVPENRIYLDYAGFRTLDSIIRADKIFGQNKFTVISQRFHNERAIYLGSNYGLDVIGFNAQDVGRRYGLSTNCREYLARVKAIFDALIGVQPKFLGEKINIE